MCGPLGLIWLQGLLAVCFTSIRLSSGNQMDPHVFPKVGPFFEGWYMRIMDQQNDFSVGWLFSRILVDKSSKLKYPCNGPGRTPVNTNCGEDSLIWKSEKFQSSKISITDIKDHTNAIILINENRTSKLITNVKYFPLNEYKITQDGQPIISNPDDKTPPHFEAKIGKNVSFVVRPNGTLFELNLGDTVVRGVTDQPVPWGPDGEGPETWIDKLPLGLHWFVYSLRSNVVHYEVFDKTHGITMKSGLSKNKPVIAHMEKNWGAAFPKAWIWAQGVDSKTNASFAISAGLLTELGFDIPAQLSNYRNPSKGIDCKFQPVTSVHTTGHDGCAGKAYLHVTGLLCQVIFEVYTKPEFLSDCLTTPQSFGYQLGCVESYSAVANITMYERVGFDFKYKDSYTFTAAALEFGGEYMCNGKCP